MNTYNDKYVEVEYGGVFVYNNTITLELFQGIEANETYIQIVIGDIEATNLMYAAENDIFDFISNDTFDLYIESLDKFNIRVSGIVILNEERGVWKSQIELINLLTNETTYIDSRTTDAVILALKEDLPIMICEDLLIQHSKKYNESEENTNLDFLSKKQTKFTTKSQDLHQLLQKYIEDENYEEAAKIKKEIDKIKGGN